MNIESLKPKSNLQFDVADKEMNERLFLATFTCAIGGFAFFYILKGFNFGFDWPTALIGSFLFINFSRFGILVAEKKFSQVGDPRTRHVIAVMSLMLAALVGLMASTNLVSAIGMTVVRGATMLTLASYAALSTMTFVSKIKVARTHVSLMLGLPILQCFYQRTAGFTEFGVLLSIYLVALYLHIRLLHKQFVALQEFAEKAKTAAVAQANETHFRELARATQESRDQLNQLFQETPFPTHIVGTDGVITMVNRAWSDLWHLDHEATKRAVNGINLLKDTGVDQNDSIKNLKKALAGGQIVTPPVEIFPQKIAGTGRSRWVERYYNPIFDSSGNVTSVLMIFRDVTDQLETERRLEETDEQRAKALIREQTALESSKLKSQFLANMSHEIRTPINGVLGMIGFLRDTTLSNEQKEFAEAAHRSAQGLLTVINDILDLSKVEAGKLELENGAFNLHEIIGDVGHVFSILSEQKNLKFKTRFDDRLRTPLFGDSNRIRQILNNLVSNAVKFTEVGEVTVSADVVSENASEIEFFLRVSDTGVGISQEVQSRLFKAFEQANASTSRKYGGSGLGLAISKNLASLMGSAIEFSSQAGEGSSFWMTLRLLKGVAAPAIKRDEDFRGDMSVFTRARILIAEDNKINQTITKKVLEGLGLSCVIAENGREVLSSLETSAFDLILMDCQMPEMDGFEATRQIRALADRALSSIPIVGFTAGAMQSDRDNCLASGMDDYLSKPANKTALVRKLGPIIEQVLARKVA